MMALYISTAYIVTLYIILLFLISCYNYVQIVVLNNKYLNCVYKKYVYFII
jgi:hypothetical protein